MTVADDLATLRGCVANCAMESGEGHRGIGEGALDRVEAEIARLTQERDEQATLAETRRISRQQYRERAEAAEAEVARLRDGLRPENLARLFHETYESLAPFHGYKTRKDSAVSWDEVPAANKALMIATADTVARALAEGGVASENVCPCGHHADQHPAVWSIAGDATTRCQAEGCHCLDYDGPGLDAPEDGAAQPLPRSEYGGYMGGEPWGPDHPSYDEMGQ